jgi:hypothetical protein
MEKWSILVTASKQTSRSTTLKEVENVYNQCYPADAVHRSGNNC